MHLVVVVFQGRVLAKHTYVCVCVCPSRIFLGVADVSGELAGAWGGPQRRMRKIFAKIFLFILACWPGDKKNLGFQRQNLN